MKAWKVRFLLALAAILPFGGCASIGPPEAPSLELPKPPTDLHAARKGDKVTLTWTVPVRTTERQTVKYLGKTEICRSLTDALKLCGGEVGSSAPPANFENARKSDSRVSASFVDTLSPALQQAHPYDLAVYSVEVLNEAGRGAGLSNQVRVPMVPTLGPFPGFSAQVTARGVLISWLCRAAPEARTRGVQYLFRIYRQLDESSVSKLADVSANGCVEGPAEPRRQDYDAKEAENVQSSFLDQSFEWERTYSYRATLVSVIETAGRPTIEVEGPDTPAVKVFAHDVFPPAVPTGLQAVFSGPGQAPFIDLIWTPVGDADIAGYNVYRHEAGRMPVKLNEGLVHTPAFRDLKVAPGATYFYSISAVDERNNESARSEETGETAGP